MWVTKIEYYEAYSPPRLQAEADQRLLRIGALQVLRVRPRRQLRHPQSLVSAPLDVERLNEDHARGVRVDHVGLEVAVNEGRQEDGSGGRLRGHLMLRDKGAAAGMELAQHEHGV